MQITCSLQFKETLVAVPKKLRLQYIQYFCYFVKRRNLLVYDRFEVNGRAALRCLEMDCACLRDCATARPRDPASADLVGLRAWIVRGRLHRVKTAAFIFHNNKANLLSSIESGPDKVILTDQNKGQIN